MGEVPQKVTNPVPHNNYRMLRNWVSEKKEPHCAALFAPLFINVLLEKD